MWTPRPSVWWRPGAGPQVASISRSQGVRAQRLDAGGGRQVIAFAGQGVERVEQAFENPKVGRGSGRARIRWKAVKDDAHMPLLRGQPAQAGQTGGLVGKGNDPLRAGLHGAGVQRLAALAPGKDGRVGGAVDLGQGDQHGGFHRPQPPGRGLPLADRLEFQRVGCDVGDVQRRQRLNRSRAVVVGRAPHQREPGQRDQGIDAALMIAGYRGAAVQAPGKGGDASQALRLEGADRRVVMRGVARQDVGAQHQQAHGPGRAFGPGQVARIGGDPALQRGMVKANLGVIDRRGRLAALPAGARGVAA